ncbi:hypothetical protein [Luteolibacter sp. Populi]|uniref:hypothetical protein n=1 Tax=Luteolibacter sp. Populi TaxID=3230487 RepID=UPI0034672F6E
MEEQRDLWVKILLFLAGVTVGCAAILFFRLPLGNASIIKKASSFPLVLSVKEVGENRKTASGDVVFVRGILFCDNERNLWLIQDRTEADPFGENVNWRKEYRIGLSSMRFNGRLVYAKYGSCIIEGKFGYRDLPSGEPDDKIAVYSISWK